MQTTTIMENHRRIRVSANAVAAFALLFLTTWSHAAMEPQPSTGDGWQVLTRASAPASPKAQAAAPSAGEGTSLAVAPVVLPGGPASGGQTLTLTIAPQDINLRNALD